MLANKMALAFEGLAYLSPVRLEPLLTRFIVAQMSTHHYFNVSGAKNELGYYAISKLSRGDGVNFWAFKGASCKSLASYGVRPPKLVSH
jgi:hypothetical protein